MTSRDEFDRRDALKLSGLTLLSSLAGCASVVREAGSDGETTPPAREASATATAGPPRTTADATDTPTERRETAGDVDAADAETPEGTTTPTRIDISEPALGLSGAPLPPDPSLARYPTMGTSNQMVTVYGNWKCPYTRNFVRSQLGSLVEEFVTPGRVSIQFRSIAYQDDEPFLGPDAPRASRAGHAVWDVDPESFWSYFAYVFENQPRERSDWATTDRLIRLARRAGVDGRDQIRQAITAKAYSQAVERTAEAAAVREIDTIPRVVGDGRVTAPTRNPTRTRAQFEAVADGNGTEAGAGGNGTELN